MRAARLAALFFAAAAAGGCSSAVDAFTPAPDTRAVVHAGSRTHEGTAPGLCQAWSGALVDTSSLSPSAANASEYEQGLTVRARGDVFGVGTLGALGSPEAQGLRVDRSGNVTHASFPVEDAAGAVDMIPTADGWMIAWQTPSFYQAEVGSLYFVAYDAAGAPLARTGGQPTAGYGLLGADPNGAIDVAWSSASEPTTVSASWVVSTLAGDGPTSFAGESAVGAPTREAPFLWRAGRLYSLTETAEGNGRGFHYTSVHLRSWDAAGHLTFDTPLPFTSAGPAFAVVAPGRDGASAILVSANEVVFASQAEELVQPLDVSLDTPAAIATPGGVTVASSVSLASSSGGGAGLQIVEIAPNGARSPVAVVPLPESGPYATGSYGAGNYAVATDDGDAVLVVSSGGGLAGALFTCTERGS